LRACKCFRGQEFAQVAVDLWLNGLEPNAGAGSCTIAWRPSLWTRRAPRRLLRGRGAADPRSNLPARGQPEPPLFVSAFDHVHDAQGLRRDSHQHGLGVPGGHCFSVVPPAEEPPWGIVGLVLLPPPVASPRVPVAPPPVGPPGEPGAIAPVPVGPPEELPLVSPVAPPCDPVAPPPDGPLEPPDPPVWASAAVMLTASAAAVRLIEKLRICSSLFSDIGTRCFRRRARSLLQDPRRSRGPRRYAWAGG
jgi:hypothetical protein